MYQLTNNILISLIISHGFLDLVGKRDNKIILYTNETLKEYIGSILYFFTITSLSPFIGITIFILMSMGHFSNDFRSIMNHNYSYMGPIVLLGSLLEVNNLVFWKNTIEYLTHFRLWSYIIIFNTIIIGFFNLLKFSLNYPIYRKKNLKENIIIFFILINGIYNGTYQGLIYYLGLFHSPLNMYRLGKKYGYYIIKLWVYFSSIIFIIIHNEYIIIEELIKYKYFVYLVLAILKTHILSNFIIIQNEYPHQREPAAPFQMDQL